ncbi:MAG: glycosyltransferase [Flavobacteriales bacterium]|nr:glycosyltransferase [Flavobacteriales bacterium]
MSGSLVIALALFAAAVALALITGAWRKALVMPTLAAAHVDGDLPFISVVIPARDEEAGIVAVLQDLHAQRYPKERMEVIVVDDGSTDRTTALVEGMLAQWPNLRLLKSAAPGKKAAITTGVQSARGELILLTDADVRMTPMRVNSIAAHWLVNRSAMIVLPVFTQGHGFLGRLQEEEQAALLGLAIGAALNGTPFLAYGANLAFTREAFFAVGGYAGDRFASGDDLFLLQRMQRAGKRITALFDPQALVMASAAPTWGAFWRQRLRWAGKMKGAGMGTMLGGLLVLLLPWILLHETVQLDFSDRMGQHALFTAALLVAAWLCWSLPAMALVRDVRTAMQQPCHRALTLVSLMAFTCYAPVIAVLSLILPVRWKGRRV